jgi:hypothetical protein
LQNRTPEEFVRELQTLAPLPYRRVNFVIRLVDKALKTFRFDFLLGDKAYLSENVFGWLWRRSIKAVIPVKMRWDPNTKLTYHEAARNLLSGSTSVSATFTRNIASARRLRRSFQRSRVTNGFVWSRGRKCADVANGELPCTAWVNETLRKLLYMNIRTTVSYQELTGCSIDYTIPARCLPKLGDDLLAA